MPLWATVLANVQKLLMKVLYTRKYPLRGCLLGPPDIFFRGGQTDADGVSGANNVMKH